MEEINDPRHGATTLRSVRPWGDIHIVVRNRPCSVDLTHVNPGMRASLHSHQIRHELFHFIDDGAYLEMDGKIIRPNATVGEPLGVFGRPNTPCIEEQEVNVNVAHVNQSAKDCNIL